MNPIDIMKPSLRIEEGLRLWPYRCSENKLTIGYGRNIEAKPLTGDIGRRFQQNGCITREDAEILLGMDAAEALRDAARLVRNWAALTVGRQAVLGEMVFQMGFAGVMAFKKMRKAIEAGDYMLAKTQMLQSKWAKQTPDRAKRYAARMLAG